MSQVEFLETIEKFDKGSLFINVSKDKNGDVWQQLLELAELLDTYSTVSPYNGQTYLEYLSSRENIPDEWDYLIVKHGSATLSNRNPDPLEQVDLSVKEIVDLARWVCEPDAAGFDSLFD